MVLGQKNIQSSIVGFLSKTENKNIILQSSTPNSTTEDLDLKDESLKDSCSSGQGKTVNDWIDDIIDLDNTDSSDSDTSPIKKQSYAIHNSEPYYIESSMEEKERIEHEFSALQKNTESLNLASSSKNSNEFVNPSLIPESSDSEEDRKGIRNCLRLNRKPNAAVKDEEKQATISKNSYKSENNSSEYLHSSSETISDRRKEKFKEHLRTPKKHVINKQWKNDITSDSDIDSPRSKCSSKGSPRKEWLGPDPKVNLKDLGLNKKLGLWIESARKKPVMSLIPTTKDKLVERHDNLKNLQIEILDKFCAAFEMIPIPILEKFPKFDLDTYKKLQDLHRHVKAKLRLVQTKLSKLQNEDEISTSESVKTPVSASTSKSTEILTSPVLESHYVNERFNMSSPSISKKLDFHQDSPNEPHIQEYNTNMEAGSTKSHESTVPNKKSTFQLKRPVKTVLGTEVSKTIAEMWEKEQMSKSVISPTDSTIVSISDTSVKDTFNGSVITSPKNENNTYAQRSIIKDSPDGWVRNSTYQDTGTFSTKSATLSQDVEQFPALGEDCNIDIEDNLNLDWHNISLPQGKQNDDKVKSKTGKNTVEYGKFTGNYKNDGVSGEFDSMTYPHSQEMLKIFRQKFGLYTFRPNQLQAINATLLGFDCFVLMPTGGGKSLCYQLPALLSNGVTIVVSPLKSLILDQVQKLISLDIPAAHLSSSLTENQAEAVYRELYKKELALKILYVTPEKLSASQKFCGTLTSLYERGLLTRFVIDEAHCVSQWGHDFRPDYKKLRCLRENYPKTPTMALTATATPRVRTDILHQLGLTNPKWFMSSFNRPNLRYSIISKKGKNCSDEVIAMILTKFRNTCGIVYCLSRKDCDDYAAQMKKNGIKAGSYHAGLTDNQRSSYQGKWIADEIHVICATIAFGMGIDKPNVRFVIHASLPKSIEGYYQESGRAGRDGEIAECILFYNYADMHRIRKMIELDNQNPQAIATHMDNLFKMVAFAENTTDCRRSQQLNYFGEIFDRQQCISNKATACDNCRSKEEITMIDATEDAKEIMKAVRDINNKKNCNLTLVFLTDIFKGSDIKKIRESGLKNHPLYGRGKTWNRSDIERLLHYMILEEYLQENMYINNEITCAFVKIGRRASELMTRKDVKVQIPIRKSNKSTGGVATVSTVNSKKVDDNIKELHDRCYTELMTLIRAIADTLDVSASSIMNMVAIRVMSQRLPETEEAMLQVPHVTKANFSKYGKALLDITQKYAAEKIVLLNEGKEEENNVSNDDNESWDTASTYSGSSSSRRGKKRKYGSNSSITTKKYKRGGASARGKGSRGAAKASSKGSSKSSTATRQNASTKKIIGLASFSQTKQYLSNPNRYMDVN